MMRKMNVAIVGATGAVGTQMIKLLENSTLPLDTVKFLASKRSAGKQLSFKGETQTIEELVPDSFEGVDLALFSAGGGISAKFAPEAVKRGAVVVDNTSHFRMDPSVPLVVPEVNPEALRKHNGIIANPNCSTIQMMVALEPIRQAFGLNRIIVSTYQAVSGAGNQAMEELKQQTRDFLADKPLDEWQAEILPCGGDKKHYPLAFNALAQIDVFAEEGYTNEEWKMINETKKIMEDETIKVSATCVRIPVMSGHSESIYIETEKTATVAEIQELLSQAPGVVLEDDPSQQIYPQALNSVGKKETFVGRIRKDPDEEKGAHLWVVSDNLLKGAAWNSLQIAETMYEMGLFK
ncbi:aspartate-semialdehyde dehydrogenase [Enterococcus malodoratus]|uniref:Aspartate-semialdehyde dehydrogenase n=1 Tax=Enterococcus malodoratus ATCC 43197 TaxID=1158601 RepID=R2NM69_9ENTE|nr:aspartate-semialdehyde dehydrogenase [Enterococcus malodoratus]EOH72078.1 aspartate-semialdehyde dehydrogenase [Enterococcus malodoratus ATCC 43197]EOT69898.1 aspartate-semialdehyde dehydrogenase [Enterococcus malodoratus ATCC 43197]OJG64161.1 aspartate-semialdehyde dehydrogenase [Enterococcus malodoratus]SPW74979.1 aspartate semialdehyde dehydrogenase [Enterococcus malodoratus]STC70739.1 aspartate semialdehyde dehydrogenase [Enterococcus malodoratus]